MMLFTAQHCTPPFKPNTGAPCMNINVCDPSYHLVMDIMIHCGRMFLML